MCGAFASGPVLAAPAKGAHSLVRHPIAMLEPFFTSEDAQESSAIGAGAKFAVFKLSGTQYKVAVNDVVVSNLIHGYDIGQSIEVSDVLLVGSQNETVVGRPVVEGATVVLDVEEYTKDKKVTIFKKRRRKNFKRTTGFRRDVTILRVTDIRHATV